MGAQIGGYVAAWVHLPVAYQTDHNNEISPLAIRCLRRAGTDIAALWLQPERTRADGRTGTGKPKRNRVAGVAVDARRHATESACDCDQR